MVATTDGRRVLLAPNQDVADFVATTYTFDEVRLEPVTVTDLPGPDGGWRLGSTSLHLDLTPGRRTWLGWLLRPIPAAVATAPWWCRLTDPVARVLLRGVRTRGSAGNGTRREYYGATDHHAVRTASGTWEGADLGSLTPVRPAPGFGFSSTPERPSVTRVVTTVVLPG